VRLGGGLLVLAVLLARLGTGPFVDGLRSTSAWTLLLAMSVTVLTTICCAWRWRVVATTLGAHLGLGSAVAAVYRAQFLNVTLPGGIVGDVDRAVSHGRHLGRLGPAIRAVVWERTLGQVVQVALAATVVLALPSPLRPSFSGAATVAVVALACGLLVLPLRRSTTVGARVTSLVGNDLRRILGARLAPGSITVTSAAATTGHLLVLLVAARATGVDAPLLHLLPLAAVVLLASALPLSVAGWGPREGVAAWAFGLAGLGATTGLAVSVAYGVMTAVATLPGGLVLLAGRGIWSARPPAPVLEEAVHG
jgi:uncharacterized membrane protein YbhN (UPF0104 family)